MTEIDIFSELLACNAINLDNTTTEVETQECDKCGRQFTMDGGIVRMLSVSDATNSLENVDYDLVHNVNAEVGLNIAKRYLEVCEFSNDEPAVVLELGGGTGLLTLGMARSIHSGLIVSCDTSLQFLNIAKKRLEHADDLSTNCMFLCADANDLPFRDESFDYVFANSFLHHIHDYKSLLSALRKLLKPGGAIVMSEPCVEGKALVSFFLNLILDIDQRVKNPVLSSEDHQKLKNVVHVMMREKYLKGNDARRLDMEDKHVFDTENLRKDAADLGFSKFQSFNATPNIGDYRDFVAAAFRLASIDSDISAFEYIFDNFGSTYMHFAAEKIQTPHQLLLFRA